MKPSKFLKILNKLCIFFLLTSISLTAGGSVLHSRRETSSSQANRHFTQFWSAFKKAVLAGDSSAVSGMVAYPFTDQYQEIYFKAYGGKNHFRHPLKQFF